MNKFVFTFGWAHDEEHKHLGLGELSSGYVVIEAPTRDLARRIGVGIFGADNLGQNDETWRWAFDYDYDEFIAHRQETGYYKAGELLRIAWINPVAPAETFSDISNERQWGWGEELEVLWDVIDEHGLEAEATRAARTAADQEIAEGVQL